MPLAQQTLDVVGQLSAELAEAQRIDDAERLAALVAACRLVEAEALRQLASRVTSLELLDAQAQALSALGW